MKTCGECQLFKSSDDGFWECPLNDGDIIPDEPACCFGKMMHACHRQRDRARKAERSMQHWGEKYVEAQELILHLERLIEQLRLDCH